MHVRVCVRGRRGWSLADLALLLARAAVALEALVAALFSFRRRLWSGACVGMGECVRVCVCECVCVRAWEAGLVSH